MAFQGQHDQRRHREAVDDGGGVAEGLLSEELEPTAVERIGHELASKNSGSANRPMAREPTRPPTKWTPTTSRASSQPALAFNPTAKQQMMPVDQPDPDRRHAGHETRAGRDGDQTGHDPGRHAEIREVAVPDLSTNPTTARLPAAARKVFMKA